MTRNAIESAMRRLHSTSLANATVDVLEPSVDYTAGEGYDVTYPDAATATYEARIDSPTDVTDKERAGTTAEIDAVVRVRDDTGQQWEGFGESDDASARVRDTSDGTVYQVEGVTDRHDGLTTLDVVEV